MRMVGGKRKRNVRTRKLTTSPKQLRTTVEWRLIDEEFIPLHKEHEFTFEACCDDEGLNSHADLPFASPSNSILDNDMSGESIFINPPWGMATTVVAHLEACRAKDVENTKAVIILPVFKQFESMVKDWKIIREWSAGTTLFTRPTVNDVTVHEQVKPLKWKVRAYLIDKTVPLSEDFVKESEQTQESEPSLGNDEDSNASEDVNQGEKKFKYSSEDNNDNEHVVASLSDHNASEPLLQVQVHLNEDLSTNNAILDAAATLNFISYEYVKANGLKTTKLKKKCPVRMANGQRVAIHEIVKLDIKLNGQEETQESILHVLRHCPYDLILGLPWLREGNVTIHFNRNKDIIEFPNTETVEVQKILRRKPHLLVLAPNDGAKLLRKERRKSKRAKSKAECFLVTVKQVDDEDRNPEIDAIKSDFGEEFDKKLHDIL